MTTGDVQKSQLHAQNGNNGNEDKPLSSETIKLTCPNCSAYHKRGTLVCPHCGMLFGNDLMHNKFATGSLLAKQNKAVFLKIDDKKVELPNKTVIVLGRATNGAMSEQPDIALNDFGATVKGVSRQHARIMRYFNLLYISDLSSSNGTFVNSKPLLDNKTMLLHNGDELQLGYLRFHIEF